MREILLLGRVLFSLIFIVAGFGHFSQETIDYAASQGVSYAGLLVPLSGALAIAGGLSILLGFRARIGGWMIALFLVPVTFMMHDFWNIADPAISMIQQQAFFKNLAMLGGAFVFTYFGSGPYSIDSRYPKAHKVTKLGTSIPTPLRRETDAKLNERDVTNSRTW